MAFPPAHTRRTAAIPPERRISAGISAPGRCTSSVHEVVVRALPLDVADPDSVRRFCAEVGPCRVLVNNAGGALGLDRIEVADEQEWLTMFQVNVLGTLRMTQGLLPAIEASGDGHVVMVGSIAGYEPYVGGAGRRRGRLHRLHRDPTVARQHRHADRPGT